MTATLKNTPQGYVLIRTLDTKTLVTAPILGNWYLTLQHGIKTKTWDLRQYTNPNPLLLLNLVSGVHEVIASETPLEGVKGIRFRVNKNIIFHNDGNYERLVKKLIDTEVEVEEHEDYYLVKL